MKQYSCIPISKGLPIIFGIYTLIGVLMFFYFKAENELVGANAGLLVSFGSALFMISFLGISSRRVEIHNNKVVCKGILPKHSFSIEYDKCNIGMDYHLQNGNQIWWIYLCYGVPPQYNLNNRANRMNSVKIRPGFVKIMYSDDVYDSLSSVLPKKQKNALLTARKCAGFDKQGKIIF